MLCRALEAAVNRAQPGGMQAHMVAQPGGGAPVLYPTSVLAQVPDAQNPAPLCLPLR